MAANLPFPQLRAFPAAKRKPAERHAAPTLRFPSGMNCDARCMFAVGPDCDCPCGGRNHGSGLRCEGFDQKDLPL